MLVSYNTVSIKVGSTLIQVVVTKYLLRQSMYIKYDLAELPFSPWICISVNIARYYGYNHTLCSLFIQKCHLA